MRRLLLTHDYADLCPPQQEGRDGFARLGRKRNAVWGGELGQLRRVRSTAGRDVRKFFKELFDSRGLSEDEHLSLSGPSVLEGVKDTARSKHDGASRGVQMGVSHGEFVAAFENAERFVLMGVTMQGRPCAGRRSALRQCKVTACFGSAKLKEIGLRENLETFSLSARNEFGRKFESPRLLCHLRLDDATPISVCL